MLIDAGFARAFERHASNSVKKRVEQCGCLFLFVVGPPKKCSSLFGFPSTLTIKRMVSWFPFGTPRLEKIRDATAAPRQVRHYAEDTAAYASTQVLREDI